MSLSNKIASFKQRGGISLPVSAKARRFVRRLFEVLFIPKNESDNTEAEIGAQLKKLEKTLPQLLYPWLNNEEKAAEQSALFFTALPQLYDRLMKDATAILQADPAAKSIEEVLIAYPGFFAIAIHRFAHQFHIQNVPLLPRIISEYAHSKTGIDIHPAATIGDAFVIDHGTGIVIGETTVIGNRVKIFQGVTIGALSVAKIVATKRHPTIEDNVVIYSGATILGGNTIVGHDSVIGGNVWLTKSIQPFSVVFHTVDVIINDKRTFEEPYNFFI
jgi:serine O-acetyltransferase